MPEVTREVPLVRVGHKGADLIAPGNTLESFDAAVAAGVDMIEFDVLPERWLDGDSALRLAHDYGDLRGRQCLTLDEGLDHLAQTGVRLDLDLKGPGYEHRVVDALRERDLVERSIISSQYRESLRLIRAAEPALRLGWSVPKARSDPFTSRWRKLPAQALVAAYRARLPSAAAAAIGAREADALMAHWRLITPRLVRAVRRAGGDIYVWTVDDRAHIDRLDALGVTGVITNDPRLFTAGR
jgi:glycerophosphoryl diester phosphodiesterase